MTTTYAPASDWNALVRTFRFATDAQRATGGRTAEARRNGVAHPMQRYVSEETAWDGFADRIVRDPAARAYLAQEAPTARFAARLIGSATSHQQHAEKSASYAVTGLQGGRKKRHESDEGLSHVPVDWEPLADLEEREELALILAGLPEVTRDTAARLMGGLGCPDDVNPGTWRKRVHDARQAIARAWRERQEQLDGIA